MFVGETRSAQADPPSATDGSVVWSATALRGYCYSTWTTLIGTRVHTIPGKQECDETANLSDDDFSAGGTDYEVKMVSGGNVGETNFTTTASPQTQYPDLRAPALWLDHRLDRGFSGPPFTGIGVHTEGAVGHSPGDHTRSQLFYWYGDRAFAVRDAHIKWQGNTPAQEDDAFVPRYKMHWSSSPASTATGAVEVRLAVAPAEPTNVRVAARDGGLDISWQAPPRTATATSSPVAQSGHTPVTAYDVQYKTKAAPDRAASGSNPATGWVNAGNTGTTTSAGIGGLNNGTSYDVRIRARNNGGWSLWVRPDDIDVWRASLVPAPMSDAIDSLAGQFTFGCSDTQGADRRYLKTDGGQSVLMPREFCEPNRSVAYESTYQGVTVTNRAAAKGALSDNDFTWAGTTYKVRRLTNNKIVGADDTLLFDVSPPVPNGHSLLGLRLSISVSGSRWDTDARTYRGYSFSRAFPLSGNGGARHDEGFLILHDLTTIKTSAMVWSEELFPIFRTGERVDLRLWDPASATPQAGLGAVQNSAPDNSGPVCANCGRGSDLGRIPGPNAGQPQNRAPAVSSSLSDVTIINRAETEDVSLSGVFSDADNDSLTITAASSDENVATVSVATDHSSLTVTGGDRGSATITVTADDGNGGTVSDDFAVTVKAAPTVASAIADVAGLTKGSTRVVSLSGVFSDPDGDAVTVFDATPVDAKIATADLSADGSSLTVTGVSAGTTGVDVLAWDTDGNLVLAAFDVTVTAPSAPPPPRYNPAPASAPDPEPENPLLARYDTNNNGQIDRPEVIAAINEYFDEGANAPTREDVIEVINLYFNGGS